MVDPRALRLVSAWSPRRWLSDREGRRRAMRSARVRDLELLALVVGLFAILFVTSIVVGSPGPG